MTLVSTAEANSHPTVSVLMSVFNGLEFLEEAIHSILNQSFEDYEFIIINDGSTDGSSEFLRSAAAKDPRIRLVEQENKGLIASLNRGLEISKGQFIARMDADDVSAPRRLELQVKALLEKQDLVIVGGKVALTDPTGRVFGYRRFVRDHDAIRSQLLLGSGGVLTHPAVTFRKNALDSTGLYNSRCIHLEDLDFFLRLTESGKAANLDEVVLNYRQHPESINHTKFTTWGKMKRQIIHDTIKRTGTEKYVNELLFVERTNFNMSDPIYVAERAAREGFSDVALEIAGEILSNSEHSERAEYLKNRLLREKRLRKIASILERLRLI